MTAREFTFVAAALRTYFPRYNMLPNDQAVELWYKELQDLPFDVISAALRKWAGTQTFPPSIAEIRAMCSEIQNGPAPDWGQAWGEVVKAIGRYGTYREKEALASMSPLTAQAVKWMGWRDICMSENVDTVRAQFRQIYQTSAKRETENRQLPEALKDTIAKLSEGFACNLLPQESVETN